MPLSPSVCSRYCAPGCELISCDAHAPCIHPCASQLNSTLSPYYRVLETQGEPTRSRLFAKPAVCPALSTGEVGSVLPLQLEAGERYPSLFYCAQRWHFVTSGENTAWLHDLRRADEGYRRVHHLDLTMHLPQPLDLGTTAICLADHTLVVFGGMAHARGKGIERTSINLSLALGASTTIRMR